MKPNEITEQMLLQRLSKAVEVLNEKKLEINGALLYTEGGFKDFVGIVNTATEHERQRAVNVARRLGHVQTARVIAQG